MSGAQHIIGIDLGTTNTVVAACIDGKAQVLADAEGNTLQPSVVCFPPNGNVLIGEAAKERRVIDAKHTIYSIKRLMGRPWLSKESREMRSRMPFVLEEGPNSQPVVKTRAGRFTAPEISAQILGHAKKIAERALGHTVSQAVITVPASFTDAQRKATIMAGSIAGLRVVDIINEPTAAAVAFGYEKFLDEIIAVYDFGGGTFDISVLQVTGDDFKVLASSGDAFLGGDDFDQRIIERLADGFLLESKVDLRQDPMAMQRLQGLAEDAKKQLTDRNSTQIEATEMAYGIGGKALHLHHELTRPDFEDMVGDLVRQTFPVCDSALVDAGLPVDAVTALILVGGTTKMPLVRKLAGEYFRRDPRSDVHPDEAIAIGAALHAEGIRASLSRPVHLPRRSTEPGMGAIRTTAQGMGAATPPPGLEAALEAYIRDTEPSTGVGDDETTYTEADEIPGTFVETRVKTPVPLAQITPRRLSVQSPIVERGGKQGRELDEMTTLIGGAPLVELPPPIPGGRPRLFPDDEATGDAPGYTRGLDPLDPSVIDDEGSVDTRIRTNPFGPRIQEVTPQALGIATVRGFCEHVIERNSVLPTEVVRVFSTSRDNQDVVRLRVCQGNTRKLATNVPLGDLVLTNLPRAPRGHTKIEVIFRLSASGILHVSARDPATGNAQEVELQLIGAGQDLSAASQRFQELGA